MNPKLTDDAVAGLPLHHGRADLLEEIMSTPVLTDRPLRTDPPRHRTTWLVPVAAAVAVLALIAGSAWLLGDLGPRDGGVASGGPGAFRAVLDAPGWTVDNVDAGDSSGEVSYVKGGQTFQVNWYPADQYDDYVEDRRHLHDPPDDGEPIEVLGLGAQVWASGADDHTAIREVENGHWLELSGSGMDKATYLDLLEHARLVDLEGLEAALPATFGDDIDRHKAAGEILDGIGRYVDPLIPPASQRVAFSPNGDEPYGPGVDVARDVACEWLREFDAAHRVGRLARADRAADVLGTTRRWPVLQEATGKAAELAEAIWGYADQVADGHLAKGYGRALACQG